AGKMQNRGIELAINARPVDGKYFQWDLTLNGSRNRNKILELAPGIREIQLASDQDVNVIAKVGSAYGVITTPYGFTPYTSDKNNPNYRKPIIQPNDATLRYKYQRGNATVGNITPDFNLGLSNNF